MLRYAITDGVFGLRFAGGKIAPSLDDRALPTTVNSHAARAVLLNQISRLASEAVDFIQLREKNLPDGELAALARDILHILQDTPTRLLLNTRIDIAASTDCHGVHLTAVTGGETAAQVRAVYASAGRPPPVVSKACHTLAEVRQAHAEQVDLILFSPVFGKAASAPGEAPHPGTGIEALRSAAAIADPIPVLALGGVTLENAPACFAAGARGIAGITLFQRSPAPGPPAA